MSYIQENLGKGITDGRFAVASPRGGPFTDAPPGSFGWGSVSYERYESAWALATYYQDGNTAPWYRTFYHSNGTWQGEWVRGVVATPPQELALPLAAGWTEAYTSWYAKNQFSYVHVAGQLSKGGMINADEVMATFPPGYQPKYNTLVLCRVSDNTGKKEYLQAVVYADGKFKMTEASTIVAHCVSFTPFDFPTT